MAEQYTRLEMVIDGRFIMAGANRLSEPVLNPATGAVLGELPHATAQELIEAADAAVAAFPAWRGTSPYDRAIILRKTATILRERADHIAQVLTLEQGKTLSEAQAELAHAIDLFDWFAEEGRRAYGRIIPARSLQIQQAAILRPVGPAAVFTPWNFPALTPARKLAAGLAAGCTLVLKASEETPGTAVEIVRALHDAGLPKGCANLVFGVPSDVSESLLAHPGIRKVSFTGSTPVGKHLMKLAAESVKRTTMELGGNAPVIVFADADYDLALSSLVAGKFRNAGQVCISPSRFFVHESLYDRFVQDFAERAGALALGNGLDRQVQMGPLANDRRLEAMERIVADAESRGAKIRTGGERIGGQGSFFAPTVMTDVSSQAALMCDETFGPIVPVTPFADNAEVFARANAVDAGLAGYVFTQSIANARAASEGVEVGMLGINTLAVSTPETPFGGVKQSGHGSEGGIEGLHAFMETRLIVQA